MRRQISRDGLYMAFGLVLAVMGLAASISGLILAGTDAAPRYATIGVIALVLLAGVLYLQFHPNDAGKTPKVSSTASRPPYLRLELFWAGILLASLILLIVVNGLWRAAWILLAAVGAYHLVSWDARRRRAQRDPAD